MLGSGPPAGSPPDCDGQGHNTEITMDLLSHEERLEQMR